jgi:cation transport ATPase
MTLNHYTRQIRRGTSTVDVLMSLAITAVAAFAFYILAEQAVGAFNHVVVVLIGWPYL